MGVGDEERWLARGRDLPHGSARAGDDEVGSSERRAELVRVGQQAVVLPAGAALELRIVALAREMEHGRPLLGERVERGLVQAP